MSQITRAAHRASAAADLPRITRYSSRLAERMSWAERMPRSSRQRVLIGGAVLGGALIAIPLTRAAVRAARIRIAARREQRAGSARGLDPLTGLPGHAEAQWWLERRLAQARSRRNRLAVLVVDIDHFAETNEAFGRLAGDHVLQVTAVRLQALLRTGDMVCRTGNDTFMVIMDVAGPDHQVARIGERVVDAVAEPISFEGETILITASVGFAISNDREADSQLLQGRADRAVIQAKASQRPIVQF